MSGPKRFCASRVSVKQTVTFHLLIFLVVVYLNGYATSQSTPLKNYSNYTVYTVGFKTQEQTQEFLKYASDHTLDIWRDPSKEDVSTNREADIMVPPEKRQDFLNKMKAIGANVTTIIVDLQRKINELTPPQTLYRRSGLDTLNDARYFRFSEIEELLRDLQSSYPDKIQFIDIGKTFEGRPMKVVYISTDHRKTKPAIWVDAGIHAREWIAPSVVLQAIHKLATDPSAADLLTSLDWYILPVFNPDGYEYSHTVDRMWRKTRSKHPNSKCVGVDANRNFEYYWKVAGASSNPCSETYAGPTFFSEPETQNVRDFLLANKDRIKLYLTYHSYGEYLLYPWGYTTELPENSDELDKLARDVNKSMVKAGSHPYKIGSSTNVLYAAAGGSDDWAKGVANISLAYTIELPGYGHGFQLPPQYINSVSGHVFTGLREFAKHVAPRNNSSSPHSHTSASHNQNRPMTQTGRSTTLRPVRTRPVSGSFGGTLPASSSVASSARDPDGSWSSRPSQTFRPAQASRPAQAQFSQSAQSQPPRTAPSQQSSRPSQSQPPLSAQPPWQSQLQYIRPGSYYDPTIGYYPQSNQFSAQSNPYGSYNYNPVDPFYSPGYPNYPSVNAPNPTEEYAYKQSSSNGHQTGYPNEQSSGNFVQGARMPASSTHNNPSSSVGYSSGYARDINMPQHSNPTNPSRSMQGARPSSGNTRDSGATGQSSANNGGPNFSFWNPSNSGPYNNPSFEEIFGSNPSFSNPSETSNNRGMESESVIFPSNDGTDYHSANTGSVSFPVSENQPRPKLAMENPGRSSPYLDTATLLA